MYVSSIFNPRSSLPLPTPTKLLVIMKPRCREPIASRAQRRGGA